MDQQSQPPAPPDAPARPGASPGAYLAGLRLDGRVVVVVGGGAVAERRLPALLDAGASVRVVAPSATGQIRDRAAAGQLSWHPRPYRPGDLDRAWYVLAATDDGDCNAQVAAEAERLRVFCVRADDRWAGTAWTPATADVDGVRLAVFSGDPGTSRRLRDGLADRLRELVRRARRAA